MRYAGWVLEVSGLGITAAGVSRLRREFAPERLSAPAEATRGHQAWGRPPACSAPYVAPRDHGCRLDDKIRTPWEVHSGTVKIDLADVSEGATTEERLDLLEQQVRDLCTRDNDLTRAIGEERREWWRQEVAAERTARGDEVSKLDARVRDLAAGGLTLEVVGLTCPSAPPSLRSPMALRGCTC